MGIFDMEWVANFVINNFFEACNLSKFELGVMVEW